MYIGYNIYIYQFGHRVALFGLLPIRPVGEVFEIEKLIRLGISENKKQKTRALLPVACVYMTAINIA